MALGLIQPLKEMSTKSIKMFLGRRGQMTHNADSLTDICDPTV
jgi:hypothetical protein